MLLEVILISRGGESYGNMKVISNNNQLQENTARLMTCLTSSAVRKQ